MLRGKKFSVIYKLILLIYAVYSLWMLSLLNLKKAVFFRTISKKLDLKTAIELNILGIIIAFKMSVENIHD